MRVQPKENWKSIRPLFCHPASNCLELEDTSRAQLVAELIVCLGHWIATWPDFFHPKMQHDAAHWPHCNSIICFGNTEYFMKIPQKQLVFQALNRPWITSSLDTLRKHSENGKQLLRLLCVSDQLSIVQCCPGCFQMGPIHLWCPIFWMEQPALHGDIHEYFPCTLASHWNSR